MPRIMGRNVSPLGALGTVRGFLSVVREVDFDEVRGRAETPPAVLVVADAQERAGRFVSTVFGADAIRFVDVRTDWFGDVDGSRYDVIFVIDPDGKGILKEVNRGVGEDARQKVLFAPTTASGVTPDQTATLRDSLLSLNTEMAPAFGRRFPELQLPAVKAIIEETSKANAQFALVSNAPAVIPIVGGLMAASADLIVLTKNQVMMVYKIAAVHGRDLNNQMAIMRELAPVVGSGFLWRTVAREAASFLPLAAGTIPKVAIAYAGTMVMGRAADYYYRFGKKPTREQLKTFTERATEAASRLSIGNRNAEMPSNEKPAPDEDDERGQKAVG